MNETKVYHIDEQEIEEAICNHMKKNGVEVPKSGSLITFEAVEASRDGGTAIAAHIQIGKNLNYSFSSLK